MSGGGHARGYATAVTDGPKDVGDFFQRRGFGETQRVTTAVVRATALDQADQQIDHRDQRRSLAEARVMRNRSTSSAR